MTGLDRLVVVMAGVALLCVAGWLLDVHSWVPRRFRAPAYAAVLVAAAVTLWPFAGMLVS